MTFLDPTDPRVREADRLDRNAAGLEEHAAHLCEVAEADRQVARRIRARVNRESVPRDLTEPSVPTEPSDMSDVRVSAPGERCGRCDRMIPYGGSMHRCVPRDVNAERTTEPSVPVKIEPMAEGTDRVKIRPLVYDPEMPGPAKAALAAHEAEEARVGDLPEGFTVEDGRVVNPDGDTVALGTRTGRVTCSDPNLAGPVMDTAESVQADKPRVYQDFALGRVWSKHHKGWIDRLTPSYELPTPDVMPTIDTAESVQADAERPEAESACQRAMKVARRAEVPQTGLGECQCWNEGQYGRVHTGDCPHHGDVKRDAGIRPNTLNAHATEIARDATADDSGTKVPHDPTEAEVLEALGVVLHDIHHYELMENRRGGWRKLPASSKWALARLHEDRRALEAELGRIRGER